MPTPPRRPQGRKPTPNRKPNSPKPPPRDNRLPVKPAAPLSAPITLDITGMVYGGYGVAQHRGQPLYIPYTIEGEKVTARVLPVTKTVAYAEPATLVNASQDRIFPECEHFGVCWGCQWQHISYEAQLLMKFDVVAEQLQRHGQFSDALLSRVLQPVIPCPQQWNYNHQATYYRLANGKFGFPKRENGYTPINLCWVLHEDLQELYESLDVDFEYIKSYTLYLGSDGQTMMVLHMLNEDLPEMEADLPTSVNVLLTDREPVNLVGDSWVRYEINGRWLRMTAGSFFRANVGQISALVSEVLHGLALTGNEQVMDLYAGVGTFSAFIADHAEVVTVVESYPPAATDADENLAAFENVDVVEGSVLEVLESMMEDNAHYDAVVLDPPSRGVGSDEMAALLQLAPQRIVYVSSNPASLGRDGMVLTQAGYTLERIQPVDVAPHTYYADMVATFRR